MQPWSYAVSPADEDSYVAECPSGGLCSRLPADCIRCSFHHNCTYKKAATFACKPKKGVHCIVSYSCRLEQKQTSNAGPLDHCGTGLTGHLTVDVN